MCVCVCVCVCVPEAPSDHGMSLPPRTRPRGTPPGCHTPGTWKGPSACVACGSGPPSTSGRCGRAPGSWLSPSPSPQDLGGVGANVNGLHLYSAFLTIGHPKRFTILPNIHRSRTHRRRSQPCKATASSSGAVRVRCPTFKLPANPLYLLSYRRPAKEGFSEQMGWSQS